MNAIASANAPVSLLTRESVRLNVRPATPDDEPELGRFFDKVSDEDRRFRFFTAAAHLSHEQLEPLVKVDHLQVESFLAFEDLTGQLVASGLLASDRASDTAEVAISVRADYRGKGVGWALLDLLAEEARKRGVRRVISIESRDNHAAIELEREKGFEPQPVEDDPTLVILSKTFR
ncbi:acetyltransferase [Sphingomonas sp. YR710]|jgi:acetyltransferase|uniref:GNAT family N-acetyltransferase n=1 Tax=Sphingomonas sp. YR710 TaxID=1882773 RepID=UPI00088DBEC8|nr:GNAT family N-acetyltransferase [Sphingomonas sp. YR710]SDD36807.1 acetyltransferase [Sphingomonas sp. YR710]